MELYLQLGHGMMKISEELIWRWGKGTAIISPRDLDHGQILEFSKRISHLGGKTLIDPQFYEPHANWPRLQGHPYWLNDYSTGMLTDGSSLRTMLSELNQLN